MRDTNSSQMGFADLLISQRKSKLSFLDEIDGIINWRPIGKVLHRYYKIRLQCRWSTGLSSTSSVQNAANSAVV